MVNSLRHGLARTAGALLCLALSLAACSSGNPPVTTQAAPGPAAISRPAAEFPPPEQFGGFDARKAYAHAVTIVGYGPRPVGSEANRKTLEYIKAQLSSFGCAVEEDAFEASTPIGRQKMRNILGKSTGEKGEVILLIAHYDSKLMPETPAFVGANDAAAAVGAVLELARLLCSRKSKAGYWFGFVDGEEAFGEWSDINGAFGSRQMAAKMNGAGDLKKIKAVLLLDIMAHENLAIRREGYSTRWLTDIVWTTARRLGYSRDFPNQEVGAIADDHLAFIRRNVPAMDFIDMDYPHWHTAADTLDKVSPRSMAIVGHVVLESLPEIEKRKP